MLGGNVVLKEEDLERTPMSSAKQGWNQKRRRGWRDKGREVVLGVVDRGWTWRCLPHDNDVLKD